MITVFWAAWSSGSLPAFQGTLLPSSTGWINMETDGFFGNVCNGLPHCYELYTL
jgi:hypothetical protein